MVADGPLLSIFSYMSLAVALDSRWFIIDLEQAEQFSWGKGKGCQMLELEEYEFEDDNQEIEKKTNKIEEEFCPFTNVKSCSSNHRFIKMCRYTQLSEENNLNVDVDSCYMRKKKNEFSQFFHDHDSICMEMRVIVVFDNTKGVISLIINTNSQKI